MQRWLVGFVLAASLGVVSLAGCANTYEPAADSGAARRAEEAVSRLARVEVVGIASSSGWVTTDEAGAYSVRGYLGGQMLEVPGGDYLIAVVVPERVGAVLLWHVVPLYVDRNLGVIAPEGRSRLSDMLRADPAEPEGRYAQVRFAYEATHLRALSIAFTSEELNWSGRDDAPPAIDFGAGARLDAGTAPDAGASGTIVLCSADESTQTTTVPAFIGGLLDEPVGGFDGQGDFLIPARLGGAVIFHAVRAELDGSSVLRACSNRFGSDDLLTVIDLHLACVGDRLVVRGVD